MVLVFGKQVIKKRERLVIRVMLFMNSGIHRGLVAAKCLIYPISAESFCGGTSYKLAPAEGNVR